MWRKRTQKLKERNSPNFMIGKSSTNLNMIPSMTVEDIQSWNIAFNG